MNDIRSINGTYAKIYIGGKWQTNVNEFTASATNQVIELVLAGNKNTVNKKGMVKIDGTIKGYKVTSDMLKQGFSKFEIQYALDDPEAYGHETIRLKGCMLTKLQLANSKAGDIITEEHPFVADDWELLDPITAN